MRSRSEVDRQFAAQGLAVKAGVPVTPAHSTAEGAVEAEDDDAAERRRERVQHEADPYLHEAPEVDCVDLAGLGKFRGGAADTPEGYPSMRQVDAEAFRRPPATEGHAAYSAAYGTPGQAAPVPAATLAPGMATRPLLADGQSRPCAPER
jgi:hypothetical protein